MNQSDSRIRGMVLTAVMTAVICVLAPLSVPIGPVPISLATFIIFLAVFVLGTKAAAVSVLLYLLLGLAGLPVFSGYAGGLAKLAGPTGGYIIGYLPMVLIAGIFIDRFIGKPWLTVPGMVLGTAALYVLGTAWFVISMKVTVGEALAMCVYPFIGPDLIKMVLASLIGPVLRSALARAGIRTAAA